MYSLEILPTSFVFLQKHFGCSKLLAKNGILTQNLNFFSLDDAIKEEVLYLDHETWLLVDKSGFGETFCYQYLEDEATIGDDVEGLYSVSKHYDHPCSKITYYKYLWWKSKLFNENNVGTSKGNHHHIRLNWSEFQK